MHTHIQGTPCQIVAYYVPYAPATRWEPEEGEFIIEQVLDEKGNPAPQIFDMLTEEDDERIFREYIKWRHDDEI